MESLLALRSADWLERYIICNACINENTTTLIEYKNKGINFDSIYSSEGEPLLSLAILANSPKSFDTLISFGLNIENKARDGTTPLNTAAMLGQTSYIEKLINLSANINTQDSYGFTPLNNACFFEEYNAAQILLKCPNLDVNIPSNEGVPPIFFAFIDGRKDICNKIIENKNFDATFNLILTNELDNPSLMDYLTKHVKAYDQAIIDAYELAKLFGLKYDLSGCIKEGTLLHKYCFDFEGYMNHLGAIAVADSYNAFYSSIVINSDLPTWTKQVFVDIQEAINYSANVVDPTSYFQKITQGDLVIVPSGWEAHSIVFVFADDKLYRCNRGNMSDGIHGIEEFIITKPQNITLQVIDKMLEAEGTPQYLQNDIIDILGLEKIGEVENPVQIAGNCVWTSLETGIEASFIACFNDLGLNYELTHALAKNTFYVWEEYDLTSTLLDVIAMEDVLTEQNVYDNLLISALENHHDYTNHNDIQRGILIVNEFDNPAVFERFDQEIGKIIYKYDPQTSSYLSSMKSYTSTYYDIFKSWIDIFCTRLTSEEYQTAKTYIQFFQTCDGMKNEVNSSPITYRDVMNVEFIEALEQIFTEVIPHVETIKMNSSLELAVSPVEYVI